MRIPSSLHFVAGFAILLLVVLAVSVEGKRTEKKEKEVVNQEDTNSGVQQKPTIFSFIRRLFPNPEKTLETLKAVAATAKPRAKSMQFNRNKSDDKDSKGKKKAKKEQAVPMKKQGKPALGTSRLRLIPTSTTTTTTTTVKPKQVIQKKTSTTTTTKVPPKTKSAKFIKDRSRTTITHTSQDATPPAARDMEVLTHHQKRDRLRQELVKETEDNCLAKILCGGGSGKPKPKEKNTFVSDSAYLIKEFFNIFDFTVDGYGEFDKKKEVEGSTNDKKQSGDEPQNDEDEEEDEDDDGLDDEEDEIYRKDPVQDAKKKYTTNKPHKVQPQLQTSKQPVHAQKTRTSKPMASFMEELPNLTRRPKPVVTTTTKKTTTTSTTTEGTTTTTGRPKEDAYSSILTGGDMAPVLPSKFNTKVNKNRLGEAVTSTMISTSVTGSATLKPLDDNMSFEIPLKTAKDSSDDDDEEDDNNKYSDDRYDDDGDGSTYHRVTLEELVGDIKLTAADLAMLRRGRSMKLNIDNVTPDKYIKSKLRQLKQVDNDVKKLRIAQKIGRSMREPRQCRQFSQIAQEVLQTCPLTTEVIRFFNANLKNQSSIEVKRTPPSSANSTGGLVLLGTVEDGSQQAYFADNSPPSSNINLENDLKNPSVPSSYGKDEDLYTVYEKRPNPNPQNAHLNQHGQDITKRPAPPKQEKEKEGDSEEEQDDEGDSDEDEEEDEEEQDDAEGRRVVEQEQNYEDPSYDDQDDDDDDDYDDGSIEDDEDGSDDDRQVIQKIQGNHQQIQGSDTNQPNFQVAFRPQPPKRPTPPIPTLPPGIIRVYGVPQPSFDKDFTTLADQLGTKPVTFFGEEDIDRPAYKRRRQLPIEDDEKEDLENVAHGTRVPKHPPLESEPVHDGEDDDDDRDTTKKPYQTKKKNSNKLTSGKPLGGLKGADGDDDDDDDDDDRKGGGKKKKVHSIETVDLNEPPFSTSGFYNPQSQPSPHDYFHHHQQPYHHHQYPHQYPHHHQHQGGPHHQYGYRPIVRPIQIIPDVQVPAGFRPTRSHMRPGRLYPLYHGKK